MASKGRSGTIGLATAALRIGLAAVKSRSSSTRGAVAGRVLGGSSNVRSIIGLSRDSVSSLELPGRFGAGTLLRNVPDSAGVGASSSDGTDDPGRPRCELDEARGGPKTRGATIVLALLCASSSLRAADEFKVSPVQMQALGIQLQRLGIQFLSLCNFVVQLTHSSHLRIRHRAQLVRPAASFGDHARDRRDQRTR